VSIDEADGVTKPVIMPLRLCSWRVGANAASNARSSGVIVEAKTSACAILDASAGCLNEPSLADDLDELHKTLLVLNLNNRWDYTYYHDIDLPCSV
jgi:hypothetical protein